jgi:ribosomal protein S25
MMNKTKDKKINKAFKPRMQRIKKVSLEHITQLNKDVKDFGILVKQ